MEKEPTVAAWNAATPLLGKVRVARSRRIAVGALSAVRQVRALFTARGQESSRLRTTASPPCAHAIRPRHRERPGAARPTPGTRRPGPSGRAPSRGRTAAGGTRLRGRLRAPGQAAAPRRHAPGRRLRRLRRRAGTRLHGRHLHDPFAAAPLRRRPGRRGRPGRRDAAGLRHATGRDRAPGGAPTPPGGPGATPSGRARHRHRAGRTDGGFPPSACHARQDQPRRAPGRPPDPRDHGLAASAGARLHDAAGRLSARRDRRRPAGPHRSLRGLGARRRAGGRADPELPRRHRPYAVRAGQDHRAHLRRRPRSRVEREGDGHPGRERRAGHLLPRRLDGRALSGRRPQDGRRGQRGGGPHLHPCRSLLSERGPRQAGDRPDAARAGGRRRHHDDAVPRPVLLEDRCDRRLQLARLRTPRRDGLHQRVHRHRQRGLAAARRLQDHRVGDAGGRRGRLGALPRLGRRPLRDPGRAAGVHQEDEGEGLHLHHRQRRPAGGRHRR